MVLGPLVNLTFYSKGKDQGRHDHVNAAARGRIRDVSSRKLPPDPPLHSI